MRTPIAVALSVVAVLGFGSSAAAQVTPKVQQGTIQPTSATDAQGMFNSYCAVCHGKEGKGNGPAAKALTKTPADLTQLSAKNGGTFPEIKVSRYIEGADEVAAHGTRDMPMWGTLLSSAGPGGKPVVTLRIRALTDYIKTLQQK